MFDIRLREDGGIVLVGRFDAAQVKSADAFFGAVSGSKVVDCKDLEYISSAGLAVLLRTQKRLAGSGAKLRLVQINRHIFDILRYSGFDQIFELEAIGSP